MLRRLLFIMLVLGSFNALTPSSAAADEKSYAASATTTEQHPLMIPAEIIPGRINLANQAGGLRNTNPFLITWLREHPEYINAHVPHPADPPTTIPLIEALFVHSPFQGIPAFSLMATLQELIRLKVHIPKHLNILTWLLSEVMWGREAVSYQLHFLYQLIDLLLEQGETISSLRKQINSSKRPGEDPEFQEGYPLAISYLDFLQEREKLRTAAMRKALDQALPPELQQIAVEYAVPEEFAKPPAAPTKSPPQN